MTVTIVTVRVDVVSARFCRFLSSMTSLIDPSFGTAVMRGDIGFPFDRDLACSPSAVEVMVAADKAGAPAGFESAMPRAFFAAPIVDVTW